MSVLTFNADGSGFRLYTEQIDLTLVGRLRVRRATRIEFEEKHQSWQVRTPGGRLLFSAPTRQRCLDWEEAHAKAWANAA